MMVVRGQDVVTTTVLYVGEPDLEGCESGGTREVVGQYGAFQESITPFWPRSGVVIYGEDNKICDMDDDTPGKVKSNLAVLGLKHPDRSHSLSMSTFPFCILAY